MSHDRWVASLDDFTDEEIVRRVVDVLRRQARTDEARRLEKVADNLAALRSLTAVPPEVHP